MGLKHLRLVEELMRRDGGLFSKTGIATELGVNYNTVLDVLSYFLGKGLVERVVVLGVGKRYRWKK